MKFFFLAIIVFVNIFSGVGQTSISPHVFNSAGTQLQTTNGGMDMNIGEPLTASISGNGKLITQGFLQSVSSATLNLTAFLEGFYTVGGTMRSTLYNLGYNTDSTASDSIKVSLWLPAHTSNSAADYSVKVILHNHGNASVALPYALGSSYYIAVNHRNHLETWSSNPVTFADITSYDFTTAQSKAYSNGSNQPMKNMVGGMFAFYAGDVNNDGLVDLTDMAILDNDATSFLYGYNASDCNGDGATGMADAALVENNAQLFLFLARPY
jgi:hypothetical protein